MRRTNPNRYLSLVLVGLTLFAGAVFYLGVALPATAAEPFHDLTHEPCFGPEDPFCTDGDGSGGDGGRVCYNCTLAEGSTDFECDAEGSTEDQCSIVYDSQGKRSCHLTGNPCW